jgi:hypothetical protein
MTQSVKKYGIELHALVKRFGSDLANADAGTTSEVKTALVGQVTP